MNWYKTQRGWAIDLPDWKGRYEVFQKEHWHNVWIAERNGEPTCLQEASLSEIKKAVERVILATNDLRRRK